MPTNGRAVVFYYPVSKGARATLTTIDFGTVRPSDVIEETQPDRTDTLTGDGTRYSTWRGSGLRVTVRAERFLGYSGSDAASFRRAIETLQSHLDRGGSIGLSLDYAKTFCVSLSSASLRGDTALTHGSNTFAAWNGSAALAAGDEVWIEGGDPSYNRESHIVSTATSTQTVLSEAQEYEASAGDSRWLRWRYFWPALYKGVDQTSPIALHELGQRLWSLQLVLDLDYKLMGSLLGVVGAGARARAALGSTTVRSESAATVLDAYRDAAGSRTRGISTTLPRRS